MVLRTGHLVLESSLTENGWTLWLEQSGALTEGFPVGNGRVKVNHTTIYVPAKPDCDAYYIAARRLIDEYKVHQIPFSCSQPAFPPQACGSFPSLAAAAQLAMKS